jgi:hypothetical protein
MARRSARDGTASPTGSGDQFFFEGIESPNGTIFPDALLDVVMPFLSPAEWKVCSYIVRRTFGWKKATDRISLDQICHGIVRRDGTPLDYGTRLDRKTAIKALRGLEAKGVIVAQRNYSAARGFEATTYGLRFRGQPPTRTLVEKFPQDGRGEVEPFPQGAGGAAPQGEAEPFHQGGGAAPPGPVAPIHRQPTGPTTEHAPVPEERVGIPAEHSAGAAAAPVLPGSTGGAASGERRAPAAVASGADRDAELWAAVLARLAAQMSAANFETWLAGTRAVGRCGRALLVAAPSGFVRDWLEARFRPLVRRALRAEAAELDDVAFVLAEEYTS